MELSIFVEYNLVTGTLTIVDMVGRPWKRRNSVVVKITTLSEENRWDSICVNKTVGNFIGKSLSVKL